MLFVLLWEEGQTERKRDRQTDRQRERERKAERQSDIGRGEVERERGKTRIKCFTFSG